MPSNHEGLAEVACDKSSAQEEKDSRLNSMQSAKTSPSETSSKASYGRFRDWLQSFEKKFLFLGFNDPCVPNTGTSAVFRCVTTKTSDVLTTAGNAAFSADQSVVLIE
jgi:hypothetical protein